MIFLGLIVALAAVVVGVAVVLDNSGNAQMSVFGDEIPGITQQWHVFMVGAVVAIVFMVGVTVATLGFRRAMNMRRELRDLRDEHEESCRRSSWSGGSCSRRSPRPDAEWTTSPRTRPTRRTELTASLMTGSVRRIDCWIGRCPRVRRTEATPPRRYRLSATQTPARGQPQSALDEHQAAY